MVIYHRLPMGFPSESPVPAVEDSHPRENFAAERRAEIQLAQIENSGFGGPARPGWTRWRGGWGVHGDSMGFPCWMTLYIVTVPWERREKTRKPKQKTIEIIEDLGKYHALNIFKLYHLPQSILRVFIFWSKPPKSFRAVEVLSGLPEPDATDGSPNYADSWLGPCLAPVISITISHDHCIQYSIA